MVAAARVRAARCRRAAALYELTDAMTSAGRPARLRDQQPRPARRRRAATTSLTGATAIMPASAPARTAGGSACARCATGSPRISSPRSPATATASPRRTPALAVEAADEALVMGLRLPKGSMRTRSRDASAWQSIVDWRTGRSPGRVRSFDARRRAHRVTASGRLLLDRILGEIAAAEPISAVAARLPESARRGRRRCGAAAPAFWRRIHARP